MIGSISKQPDIKLYLSSDEAHALQKQPVDGKVWSHISNSNGLIQLLLDTGMTGVITNPDRTEVRLGQNIYSELLSSGFVGGLRVNGAMHKVTLIVRERLGEISNVDDRMNLEFGLEILEEKFSGDSPDEE